jgi:hypothetical protein
MKINNKFLQSIEEFFLFWQPIPTRQIPNVPEPLSVELTSAQIEAMPVSCLVLGLVKSIEENPIEWAAYGRTFYNHSQLCSIYFDSLLPTYFSSSYRFNKKEQLLLKVVIDKFVENQRLQMAKKLADEAAKQNKYFEELGYPVEKIKVEQIIKAKPKKKLAKYKKKK